MKAFSLLQRKQREMGSASCILCLVLFIISIYSFYCYSLMDAAWDLKKQQQPSEKRRSSRAAAAAATISFSAYDEKDTEIEKVSGEDSVSGGDVRLLMLEKFQILLGLSSSSSTRKGRRLTRSRHGFSPSPAPMEEVEAVSPAPVPSFHRLFHHAGSRPPGHQPSHVPPVQDVKVGRRYGSKSSVGRIVVSALVSAGAMLLVIALTVVFVCYRLRRKRKHRPERTMPVTGSGGWIPGPKISNPSDSVDKMWIDPALELYQQNSFRELLKNVSSPNQNSETKNTLSDEDPSNSPSHIRYAIHRSESLSSSDESFHSVCNSCPSPNVRISNVLEANLSHSSEMCSFFSKGSPSSDHSLRAPTIQLSLPKSPIQEMYPSHSSHSMRREILTDSSSTRSICSSSFLRKSLSPHTPSDQSKISVPMEEENSTSTSIELFTNAKKTQQESMSSPQIPSESLLSLPSKTPVSVGNVPKRPPPPPQSPSCKKHTSQPSSPPSISNGNVSKPPAPPTPPPLPPKVKKTCNSGQPPPPPLPPQLKKACNSGQPPPPPPCLLQSYTPIRKDGTPLPKLKPLHWDKVRAASDRSMVWDKIQSSSFELDEEMIESLFGYNLQSSTKKEEVKSKSSSPSKHVLEPKRLQNITILLKALNATAEQVCHCLLEGSGLGVQQLEALAKMGPTKEEEEKLMNYEGDINELGSAEKFVKEILSIPFSFARIEVMLYKETFEDEVVHLRKSFKMLEEACKELRSSQLFLRLLEAVLKTGNRMNVGTIRGGAKAFKLDALLKLADVKGTDGKTNLLHFVVQEVIRSEGVSAMEMETEKRNQKLMPKTMEQKEQNNRLVMGLELVSGLSEELCNVKKTASIDLDVLANSVSNLSSGMDRLQHLIKDDLLTSTDDRDRSFMCLMTSFLSQAKRSIKELKEDEDQVLSHVREITEYFHGEISKDKANPLQIFVIVRDFLGMLDRVCKEIRSSKTHHSPNHAVPFRYT